MAQKLINLGATGNDGTGQTLRSGGQDINDNFTELYNDKADLAGGNAFTGTQTIDDDTITSASTTIVDRAIAIWDSTLGKLKSVATTLKLSSDDSRVLIGNPTDNGVDKLQVNGGVFASNLPNTKELYLGAWAGNVTKKIFLNLNPNSGYRFQFICTGGYVMNSKWGITTSDRIYGELIEDFKNGEYIENSTYLTFKNHLLQEEANCTINDGLYQGLNFVCGIELTLNGNAVSSVLNYYLKYIEQFKSTKAVDQVIVTTANSDCDYTFDLTT
jgi:hypothetical protein